MKEKEPKDWLVDDDETIRWVLQKALERDGMSVRAFADADKFVEALNFDTPDVVITDIRMPGKDGFQLLDYLNQTKPEVPVIVITAHSDLASAVTAFQRGAFEYLPKPFDTDAAVDLVRRAAIQSSPPSASSEVENAFPSLIGKAPAMQEVFRAIGRLSRSSMTVLITGESGTGKELVASALHQHSPRAEKPFIALNTSAVAPDLLESELFGHERGSFTGAERRRIGRFEQADGGTLFLDEIGDMSLPLQTRLLRVLAEGEFYRVGAQHPITVDVRVIAATHQDLSTRVANEQFRDDLFHRLNVIRINTPPLRERREDIQDLLKHYLNVAARELGTTPKTLHADALAVLRNFDWPGNVRQLVNTCRRLTVSAPGREIRKADIPNELNGNGATGHDGEEWTHKLDRWARNYLHEEPQEGSGKLESFVPLLQEAVPELERTLIEVALSHTNGHRQEAAKLLGWGRNTLARKMKELNLD